MRFGTGEVFYGRFTQKPDGFYLMGQFRLSLIARAFHTVWFGGIALFCVLSVLVGPFITRDEGGPMWLGLLLGLAYGVAGAVLAMVGWLILYFTRRLSRADVTRVVRHIEAHVGHNAV